MLSFILLGLIFILFFIILTLINKGHLKALTKAVDEAYASGAKNALEASRRTIKAKVSEEMLPLLPGLPFNTSDMFHMGNPIDYLVISGYKDAIEGGDNPVIEIVLCDVKTGKARLTKGQQRIKEALLSGKVSWATITLKEDGSLITKKESYIKQPEI